MKGFTTTYSVDNTPKEVFDAINNVRGWWSGDITGSTDKLGAEFTYRYKDFHRSTQKITKFVPGKKVVWHVSDSYLGFVKDKTEWNGTDIVFEITKKDNKTQLTFTHVGLVPDFECYHDCSNAWGSYVNDNPQETDSDRQGKTQQERIGAGVLNVGHALVANVGVVGRKARYRGSRG